MLVSGSNLHALVALDVLRRISGAGGSSVGEDLAAHVAASFAGATVDGSSAEQVAGSVILLVVRANDSEAWIGKGRAAGKSNGSLGGRHVV